MVQYSALKQLQIRRQMQCNETKRPKDPPVRIRSKEEETQGMREKPEEERVIINE